LDEEDDYALIYRDEDVLDTWFSSALWPFSTLGWPDETLELKRFYPTTVLVTGFDIIFFWVARMMMMGIHFLGEVPFKTVFIHNRVLDEQGAKMSKTKGNVVDPLTLIDEFGADALRFTLALAAGQSRDMRIGPARVETNRNFGTKLWNAARFCEMNQCATTPNFDPTKVSLAINRWIVGEVADTAGFVRLNLTSTPKNDANIDVPIYRFDLAATHIYQLVWDKYCDWYLEFAKPVFASSDENAKSETRATAAWARDQILKLLHPFMPFITEELWAKTATDMMPRQHLLLKEIWPQPEIWTSDPEIHANQRQATEEIHWVIDLIKSLRSVRSEMNIQAAAKIPMLLDGVLPLQASWFNNNKELICTMARVSSAGFGEMRPGSIQFAVAGANVILPLEGIVDFDKEQARLAKELKKAKDELARLEVKLANARFLENASEEAVGEERRKMTDARSLAIRLEAALTVLRG
jgi:valyl-tRNA synthetase